MSGSGKHSSAAQPERLDTLTSTDMQPLATARGRSGGHAAQSPLPAKQKGRAAKKKRGRGRRILSTLLIVTGLALLGVAAYLWGTAQMRYWQQDKVNKELAQYATVYDDPADPRGPEVDWASLKAINGEVIGWLQVPGTTINYPVYQADNNERYLRHSATGEWTLGGQLFADCDGTRPGMVDALTMIYGHHLLDGSMFEQIAAMDDQETFNKIDTVWYATEDYTWELEPLFMYYTQPDDQTARTFNWQTQDEFHSYLSERLGRAVTSRDDTAQIIGSTQHVLCLITCNYYDGYGRSILVCVPKDEAAQAAG